MFKQLSILPVFAILLCSACDDSKTVRLPTDDAKSADKDQKVADPETRSASKTSTDSSSSSASNPAGAFETKLASLVTQKAPWGDIEISVQKARVLRGDKPAGFPSAATHSKSSVYAILDVKLESKGDQENDYKKRDTWDLLLKNGSHIKPLNPVGVALPAGGTQTVSLFYKVEDNAKLNGASLEINGSDRDALEPLPIPLDEKTEFASQRELSELVGESFESDGKSGLSYTIVDAVYGVNLEDSGRRAPRDKRLVELTVRVGYDGDSDETSFDSSDDAPRLSYEDHLLIPDAFDTRTIESGHSHDFVMVYGIDEQASYVDLVVDSSDFEMGVELPALADDDQASRDAEGDGTKADSRAEVDSSDESSDDELDSSDESSDDSADSDETVDSDDSDDSDDFGADSDDELEDDSDN